MINRLTFNRYILAVRTFCFGIVFLLGEVAINCARDLSLTFLHSDKKSGEHWFGALVCSYQDFFAFVFVIGFRAIFFLLGENDLQLKRKLIYLVVMDSETEKFTTHN
ncbi:hypothetical protein CDAR_285831 [Caerostris darwini]|uniref:CASP-like protein n=1 Tax=Caerostris darwini TaxID=1538125 RepID=A0AAV4SUZ2_9ARAC|nr:hypothetical protein CDAR_285831 [Caerostris darwini]